MRLKIFFLTLFFGLICLSWQQKLIYGASTPDDINIFAEFTENENLGTDFIKVENSSIHLFTHTGEKIGTITIDRKIDVILDYSRRFIIYKAMDINGLPDGILRIYDIQNNISMKIPEPWRVTFASLSPDDKKVAFVTWMPDYRALYILDLEGFYVEKLVYNNVKDYSVNWNPNGKEVVYVSEEEGDAPIKDIWIANIYSKELNQITNDGISDNSIFISESDLIYLRGEYTLIKFNTYKGHEVLLSGLKKIKRILDTPEGIGIETESKGETLFMNVEGKFFPRPSIPLKKGVLTNVVAPTLYLPYINGQTWLVTQAYNGSTHQGIDYYAIDFTLSGCDAYEKPILSTASGTVIYAGGTPENTCGYGGYGLYVKVDHGGGYVSLYGHNSSLSVSVGQTVCSGTELARAGNSGNACGSSCSLHPGTHLHFRMTLNENAYQPEPLDGYTGIATGQWLTSNNGSGCSPVDDLLLENQTISSGQQTFQANNSITAQNNFIVEGSADVTFRAGSVIHLRPGFQVREGAVFHTIIGQ